MHAHRRPLAILFTTLGLGLVTGCNSSVSGGNGDGDGGGTASAGNGAGSGSGGSQQSVALYGSELPPSPSFGCDEAVCPDNMLFLFAATDAPTCETPYWEGPDLGGPGMPQPDGPNRVEWGLAIGVPAGMQRVGTYELATDERYFVTSGELIVEDGGSVAAGTGGLGASGGTLEIVAIDDTTVRYRIQGVTFNTPSDGEYVAARCGATSPPIEGAALPADDGGLTFVIESVDATCASEIATTCSGDDFQVTVTLPSQYLVPGTYSLSDPLITTNNCTAAPKFLGGTITIFAIDDASVVLRFDDVVDHVDELQRDRIITRCAD